MFSNKHKNSFLFFLNTYFPTLSKIIVLFVVYAVCIKTSEIINTKSYTSISPDKKYAINLQQRDAINLFASTGVVRISLNNQLNNFQKEIYSYQFTKSENNPLLVQPNFYWSKDSSQVILTSKCPNSRCIKTKYFNPVMMLDGRESLSFMYDIKAQSIWNILELSPHESFQHENIKNIQWFSTIDSRVVPVKLIK